MAVETVETAFSDEDLKALIGRELPGGVLTIPAHRQWLLNDVLQGPMFAPGSADSLIAHPLFVYLATGAMGVSWDELFDICGSKAEDGPMFGEHETVLHQPLEVGGTYSISGRFCSALRKEGRRAGVFDIIGYELALRDPAGAVVATTTNSIVFPRRAK